MHRPPASVMLAFASDKSRPMLVHMAVEEPHPTRAMPACKLNLLQDQQLARRNCCTQQPVPGKVRLELSPAPIGSGL